ncbi:MAG TPA: PAS domain S-box protein, partial [Magnetospirillum sp.]|nr:PAS domain S-box protein [Magnetospirillum sp.]
THQTGSLPAGMLHYLSVKTIPSSREFFQPMAPPSTSLDQASAAFDVFPEHLAGVLADLSCVLFRRELLPGGEIRYPWMSANVREIFGYDPAEMTVSSKGALNAVHWADRDAHVAAILRSAISMSRCLESFRAVTAEGETRWFRGSSAPRKLDDGRLVWDGVWIDISGWMRAEHQFQTVMDHAEDVILTLDSKNGIDWANAATERLFGRSLDQMLGQCLSHLMASPCRPDMPAHLSECGMGDVIQCFPRGTQEVMARRKDGSVFPFEMTVSEVRSDGRLSLIVIGRDITRRKATELMLEETERRLRSIASNLPGVVFQRVLDPDGTFAYPYVSDGIEEILGCEAADIVFDSSILFDAMLDGDRQRLLEALVVSADTLEAVDEDVRVTGADGRVHWLSGQSRPRRRGETIVWDGLLLDVTDEVEERIKAEQAVRESEERFRLAFAAAVQGIIIAGTDGTIRQCNPAFQRMTGTEAIAPIGLNIRQFIDSESLPRSAKVGESFAFDLQPQLADGKLRHWRVQGTTFSAVSTDAAPSLLMSVQDVTDSVLAAEERRQLEMALTEGQKLEALGRLAGGVAHELNNMLGPILMGAEMITRTAELDTKNAERVGRIISAAKHGRDIVRNVLAYCRKEQKVLSELDVVPVFCEFSELAASILPPSIKVETHLHTPEAHVVGDGPQITQVLLNLANNARDAMDGEGTLRLSLDIVAGDRLVPRQTRNNLGRPRKGEDPSRSPFANLDHTLSFVDIRIKDSGCGMPPEVAAKIFDPFFTTKPVGQGTGLGLSVVQGIIKAMGGAIAVGSAPGCGSEFRIVLPLVEPAHLAQGRD